MSQFEIVSVRTVGRKGPKKFVEYTVVVRKPQFGGVYDSNPITIERRYTDFLELYTALRQKHGALTSGIFFPKKVIIGNFAPNVILMRSCSFENFLKFIAENEKLRESDSLRTFLIGREEKEAEKWLGLRRFSQARPILEYMFVMLNKIHTDRHPSVMMMLCKLLACCTADPSSLVEAEKYASLALRRFDGVCDVDLLRYYVPLLHLCDKLWWTLGRDREVLAARLDELKRRGHRVDGSPPLLEAVMTQEVSATSS